jgi:integrase
MPYAEVSAFLADVQRREATAAEALELTILTAARSGETLLARKAEFDVERAVWTVPPERMKSGREHRVPLSRRALKVVKQAMADYPASEFLFPGRKLGKPLSAMALEMMLRRMKVEDATVQGFRSSFRDWASECTNFTNEVCEAAFAHVIEDQTEAAYRRGDLFEKRPKLMEGWAVYCAVPKAGKVVAFRAKAQTERSHWCSDQPRGRPLEGPKGL